jgi:predicted esterase YcpF (UPF0227 family)
MVWYKQDFTPKSKTLVIALGSAYDKAYDPNKFEWFNTTDSLSSISEFKKLFVKDMIYGWYQTQFEGLEKPGPHCLANFLKEKVKESGAKRTLIIGASMGGYGAILLACLANLDLAIAISPQTHLDKRVWNKYKLENKFKDLNINKEETDLKVILKRYGNKYSQYHIYFGKYHEIDLDYAERISHFPGVKLFPLESARHTVGKIMRDSGMTKDIILKFIQEGV